MTAETTKATGYIIEDIANVAAHIQVDNLDSFVEWWTTRRHIDTQYILKAPGVTEISLSDRQCFTPLVADKIFPRPEEPVKWITFNLARDRQRMIIAYKKWRRPQAKETYPLEVWRPDDFKTSSESDEDVVSHEVQVPENATSPSDFFISIWEPDRCNLFITKTKEMHLHDGFLRGPRYHHSPNKHRGRWTQLFRVCVKKAMTVRYKHELIHTVHEVLAADVLPPLQRLLVDYVIEDQCYSVSVSMVSYRPTKQIQRARATAKRDCVE